MENTTTTTQTPPRRRGRNAAIAGVLAVLGLCLGIAWALNDREGQHVATTAPAQSVSKENLTRVANARVFFGHQSVGANVVDGIPAVFADAGVEPPPITTDAPATSDGFFVHAYIGENTQPLSKIQAFDTAMRSGMAEKVDVAAMKLCWVDFNASTDVDAVFTAYRTTLDALARDFPDVTFLHITTPLTTESTGLKARVKGLLGRDTNNADNVVREQYNALMRQAYSDTGRLFDLARVEATAPDGTYVTGEYRGSPYYALAPEYASDPGHLNALGSQTAAAALLTLIARQPGL